MFIRRAIRASFWSGADIVARQGLQLVIAVVLARLLTPSEFGTIALLYLFTGLASALADSGFSSALIQDQTATHTDESTVFWFNAAAALLVALALCASAGAFVAFYHVHALFGLTIALAINVFITSLGSIHSTLLTKRTEFHVLLKISVVASVVAGIVAISMAAHGFGVWSLAAQALTSSTITTLLLWYLNRWRPSFSFSMDSMRRLWKFGGYVMISGLIDVTYNRGYMLLIGRFIGVSELGYYERAEGTKQMPASTMSTIFSRVALPLFSEVAPDTERLRRGVRQAVRSLMLLNAPIMFGVMASADALVATMFGSQWKASVVILQVLCVAGLLWPLHVINLNALLAQGRSHLYFRIEIVKKVASVLLLIAGLRFGVLGVAWSQVVAGVLAFAINAHYSRVFLDYGPIRQLVDFIPVVTAGGLMALVVSLLGRALSLASPLMLITQVATGVAAFSLIAFIFRVGAIAETIELVRSAARGSNV